MKNIHDCMWCDVWCSVCVQYVLGSASVIVMMSIFLIEGSCLQ
jgi:hypothetical protein